MADQDLELGMHRLASSLVDRAEHHLWEVHRRLGLSEDAVALIFTLGVLVCTLLFVYVLFCSIKRKKRNTILLLGLSGGGKTALFYQLRDGTTHRGTVTSMEPNEGHFILDSETERQNAKRIKMVHVVDVPGHPRLKSKIDEFLPQASGIVFVVDALDFVPQVRNTAEYLYDILTKELVVRMKIPVILACNKMDKVTAHSVEFIRRQLEKEIDKLRTARKSTGDTLLKDTNIVIGSDSEPFQFTQCVNKVSSSAMSVLDGRIETVAGFIREYVEP